MSPGQVHTAPPAELELPVNVHPSNSAYPQSMIITAPAFPGALLSLKMQSTKTPWAAIPT